MNDRELIEHLVQRYLSENPDFEMPPRTQHPLILAMTIAMTPTIMKSSGGLVPYWRTLLGAAQLYFDPKDNEFEFRSFRCRFNSNGAFACQAESEHLYEITKLTHEFLAWTRQPKN